MKAAGDCLSGLMQAPANRKDMERMEEAVAGADEQQLQHMLSHSSRDHQAVMNQVALETDQQLGGGEESCLIIDESGFKKSGGHSAGVARQWCGRLGKVDNCQVGVFAALGRESRVCLVEGRLYLPREWTRDAERCRKAGIPPEHRVFKSKSQLALEMVSHQRRLGCAFRGLASMGDTAGSRAFCATWRRWARCLSPTCTAISASILKTPSRRCRRDSDHAEGSQAA